MQLQDAENSPEELERYRAYYLEKMEQALEPANDSD